MASLLFLLLAANNLIKILRDSIFLGHHSVSELPYLYISVALVAGVVIATYTRYTANLSIIRLILTTNVIILSNIAFFWFVLTYFDPVWSHYAFYVWSAIASVTAVAQLWTLANQIFTPEEGKRSFGLLTAGGTAGGAAAGFGVNWSLPLFAETNHLLWVVGGLYIVASALVLWAERPLERKISEKELGMPEKPGEARPGNIGELVAGSTYLKTIAVVIFVSVIVSTLIDFQFKAAAKQAYPSRGDLAGFFSSYYGWLSVATFFVQFVLTGKALSTLGLKPSLYFTPAALLAGAMGIMIWPSLLGAALTRMADVTLRTSIHRSGMEIIYMAVPTGVMKRVKSFLDVVVERTGDASAGLIILLFSLFLAENYINFVHFICVVLLFLWIVLVPVLQAGYSEALRKGLIPKELPLREDWLASSRTRASLGD
jgi:AAA family ATP:ADP antiporter